MKTKQRELHFTRQLDGMFDILRRVEASTANLHQDPTPFGSNKFAKPPTAVLNDICEAIAQENGQASELLEQANRKKGTLTEAILPLIQARQFVSLASVGNEVVKVLNGSMSTDMPQIRVELILLLWDKRLTLDSSIDIISVEDHQAQIENYDISQEISIYFESMYD